MENPIIKSLDESIKKAMANFGEAVMQACKELDKQRGVDSQATKDAVDKYLDNNLGSMIEEHEIMRQMRTELEKLGSAEFFNDSMLESRVYLKLVNKLDEFSHRLDKLEAMMKRASEIFKEVR